LFCVFANLYIKENEYYHETEKSSQKNISSLPEKAMPCEAKPCLARRERISDEPQDDGWSIIN
jgi:hypothetical protein